MNGNDTELTELRTDVSCALLLERDDYSLNKAEGTRKCLKYWRGAGEVIIVNRDGLGWWDPMSQAKGDVFSLGQHLDPRLNFGQVRKLLRGMVGMIPAFPEVERRREKAEPCVPVAERWEKRRRLSRGSATWSYLTTTRGLLAGVLQAADLFDAVREGPHGSAWFAHRDHEGQLTGIEMRGPDWRGFSEGTDKTLFRTPDGTGVLTRLVVCEAPIDALSLAALEALRPDTLYVSTTGGMGPFTLACMELLLQNLAGLTGGVLVAATDADKPGERYAVQLASMAQAAGVRSERLLPLEDHNDWNDALMAKWVVA